MDADKDDGYFINGDWYLNKKSLICVKMVCNEERDSILSLLDPYQEYTAENPHTFLPHWYALMECSVGEKSLCTVLITRNFLHTVDTIDMLLDLKGCFSAPTAAVHSGSARMKRSRYALPLNANGVSSQVYEIAPTQMLRDHELRQMLISKGSPVILHVEDREFVLGTLAKDTRFLTSLNVYGYALVVAIHHATPWDLVMLSDLESTRYSRVGGHDPVEDRYHIQLVGPFKVWNTAAKMKMASASMLGRSGGTTVPPDQYALRLREMVFDMIVEFGENFNYNDFRRRRREEFARLMRGEPEHEDDQDDAAPKPPAHKQKLPVWKPPDDACAGHVRMHRTASQLIAQQFANKEKERRQQERERRNRLLLDDPVEEDAEPPKRQQRRRGNRSSASSDEEDTRMRRRSSDGASRAVAFAQDDDDDAIPHDPLVAKAFLETRYNRKKAKVRATCFVMCCRRV